MKASFYSLIAVFIAVVMTSCTMSEDNLAGEWEVLKYSYRSASSSGPLGKMNMSSGFSENPNCSFFFDKDGTGELTFFGYVEQNPDGTQTFVDEYKICKFDWTLHDMDLYLEYKDCEPFLGCTEYELQVFGNSMLMSYENDDDDNYLDVSIKCRRK